MFFCLLASKILCSLGLIIFNALYNELYGIMCYNLLNKIMANIVLLYPSFAIEILVENIVNVYSAKSIPRFIERWQDGLQRALTKIQYRECRETSDTPDLQYSCK